MNSAQTNQFLQGRKLIFILGTLIVLILIGTSWLIYSSFFNPFLLNWGIIKWKKSSSFPSGAIVTFHDPQTNSTQTIVTGQVSQISLEDRKLTIAGEGGQAEATWTEKSAMITSLSSKPPTEINAFDPRKLKIGDNVFCNLNQGIDGNWEINILTIQKR